jgi:hypothetical protein
LISLILDGRNVSRLGISPRGFLNSRIVSDLDNSRDGAALKIPLDELGDTKAKIRSALNRATRKDLRNAATATDEGFLYVWNVEENSEKPAK